MHSSDGTSTTPRGGLAEFDVGAVAGSPLGLAEFDAGAAGSPLGDSNGAGALPVGKVGVSTLEDGGVSVPAGLTGELSIGIIG